MLITKRQLISQSSDKQISIEKFLENNFQPTGCNQVFSSFNYSKIHTYASSTFIKVPAKLYKELCPDFAPVFYKLHMEN